MKQIILIINFILFTFLFTSCKKENAGDCFKTSKHVTTETRNISGFKKIRIDDKFDVFVKQGQGYEVKVEAGKDLLSNIKTEVTDSILYLKNINKCNFMRNPKNPSLKIYITLPYLRYIRNGSTGKLKFENCFIQDSMEVRIGNSGDVYIDVNLKYLTTSTHGNGDLYVTGKADYSTHYTNGTNYLHFENLVIKNQLVLSSYTIGDCYVNAPENGYASFEIWEAGNVYYTGNPANLDVKLKGKGQAYKQ